MPFVRYTADQLHGLRQSPLVRRPDGLPAIEQWMDPAPDQNGQRRKQQNGRSEEPGGVQEGAAQRPLFPTRHSTRNSNSEDLVLGPPTTAFASSARNKGRVSDVHDKGLDRQNATTFGDDAAANDRSNMGKFVGIRDPERTPRDRNNALGRRPARDGDGDGWTPVARARRSSQVDEGDRWHRLADREKKEADPADEQPRRNGAGRGRIERTWQREEQAVEADAPKTGARNWRERDRERERDRDRDWTRGNRMPDRVEEDPEWMDAPAPKEGKKQAHTQEDFERWKETMKATNRASEERDEPQPVAKENPKATPLKLDLADGMFGMWGDTKKTEAKKAEDSAAVKLQQAKAAKASRFVGLFQKEETPPAEPEAPPAPLPPVQATNGSSKNKEDEEGFARILQMLGGTKIGAAPQQPPQDMGQNRQMMPNLEFERKQNHTPVSSSRPESARLIQDLMARVEGNKSRGPQTAPLESESTQQYFPSPGADYGRGLNGRNENMTPRAGGMFSPPLPQDMHMGGRRLPEGNDGREFLLSLIQEGRQRHHEPEQFNNFGGMPGLQKRQVNMQHDSQQRGAPPAPPGLHDGPFSRREQEPDMQSLRKTTSRPQQQQPPPGFFDYPDDPAIMGGGGMPGLTRRNTTEQQQSGRPPMSNMGIPSQQAPADPFRMNMPPPNAQERNMAPPPGFAPRPPPGFQGPPMPHSVGNTPLGHPGLRDPRGPQGMFVGPGMPPGGMPPPPGYFGGPLPPQQQGMPNGPPPGFGPGPGPRDHREFLMMQQAQAEMMGRGRGGMPPNYM